MQTFLDAIDDDVELAKKGQVKMRMSRGQNGAASGGARPLHRVTKVRAVPAPAAAIGIPSGDPV
eukprot:1438805-Pyramimonas_sp.AAC.1